MQDPLDHDPRYDVTAPRTDRIRLGASACLLGAEVRFDGQHKQNRFVRFKLGELVDYVPICPEVELGMGIPRETIRLVERDGHIHLMGNKSGDDYGDRMRAWSKDRCEALGNDDITGYILQPKSPSCGMERVKIYNSKPGHPARHTGRGLFAEALIEAHPMLPVEEAGRLNDPQLRENFIERIYAFHRLRTFFGHGDWTIGGLVAFHTREKLLLMAHKRTHYDALGKLVASAKGMDRTLFARRYCRIFMASLASLSTIKTHTNVLQHMIGHFKRHLDPTARQELAGLIADFRAGYVPLTVPLTLLRHHIRQHDLSWLAQQTYLSPHPKSLALRQLAA